MTTPYVPISTVDAALDKIATATTLRLCSGASIPTDRAAAVGATLGSIAVAGGDFSKSNITGGRRLTVANKADATIDTTGDGTYMTLDDGTVLVHAKPVTGSPVSVTEGTTRDLNYGYVEFLFEGTVV